MAAYYNEFDPYAAQWLRNLIKSGHIAGGDVDQRSVADVRADDLRSYAQCHFFAGIGGWSYALRLAGWPDDRPVWTGSCPCQPFSAAGVGKAADDERHLWPVWFPLIQELRPATVFGEQVEAAVGWGWLDAVFYDLEQEGYACGASVLPACSVGAPHIRQRLWFVADADGGNASHGAPDAVADADGCGRRGRGPGCGREARHGTPGSGTRLVYRKTHWADAEWIECTDGKTRPVGPGASVLAHGIRARASKLRAYGNAIVPQAAAEFIRAAASALE